jgi:AcrR family transcriptional regulator
MREVEAMVQSQPMNASQHRRERERLQMRGRLLDAARQIASAEGWQAVTIRRIADRLEYSSPILYQHFSGKDALLWELVREGFRELAERLRGVASDPADTMLATVARTYWDFAFAEPEVYQLMHGFAGVPFGTAETPQEAREAFRACQEALLHVASAQGRTLADPDGAVDTLWSYMHGFVSLTMSRRIAGDWERARDLMLRTLPSLLTANLR